MKKILSALSEWVRSHGHHDTALGHLLQFIYRFFASWPIQAATSTLGTVVIASMFAKAYYGCFFWIRFLYKGIIIKHNKTEPTYTKTSLFLCEKRRFFMGRTEKGGKVF